MKRYLALSALVVLSAAGTYFTANRIVQPAGFVVYQVQRLRGLEERRIVRSYKSNGEWREISTDSKTGSQKIMFGSPQFGVVQVNDQKRENEFIGGWGAPLTAEQIRKDHQYTDESQILGYRVLRVHLETPADGSQTDLYRAPELHGMILKAVSKNSDGSVLPIEPEKIEVTEPEFTVPSYPVTRDVFNLHHPTR